MPSKQKTRRRPEIEHVQLAVKHEVYILCGKSGCRNVIARWLNRRYCSRCMADTR